MPLEQIYKRRPDKYANQSYDRSAKAWEAGKFDNEIVPVAVPKERRPYYGVQR
jgi:acetyl-CoA C-acetyltransferase